MADLVSWPGREVEPKHFWEIFLGNFSGKFSYQWEIFLANFPISGKFCRGNELCNFRSEIQKFGRQIFFLPIIKT
jgi:hypothetical protein